MENQQASTKSESPLHYFIFASDPQYSWNSCTDGQNCRDESIGTVIQDSYVHCGPCDRVSTCSTSDSSSEGSISVLFHAIAQYVKDTDNNNRDKFTVMLNGDMTAYGHGGEWSKVQKYIKEVFRNQQIPLYFGLGNHDAINNLSDCANDGCVRNSVDYVYRRFAQNTDGQDISMGQYDVWLVNSYGGHVQGSFSYYLDIGDVRLIQLNAYPTAYPAGYQHIVSNGSKYVLDTSNLINWLTYRLDTDKQVILCLHQADPWAGNKHVPSDVQESENAKFREFIQKYRNKILAVFAGHFHYDAGDYSNYSPYANNFGGAPVFTSGSAMYKSYLIAEQYSDRLEVYLVCGNYNSYQPYGKHLLKTIPFSHSLRLPTQSQVTVTTLADLEKITQQVHALFSSPSHTDIVPTVSSDQLNQVLQKIETLSPEVFSKEQTELRKLLNKAKQLLRARNLLVGGDFETLDKWILGRNTTVINSFVFPKERSLLLRLTDGVDMEAYAYQKIDESKLKPYTRYRVSGCNKNSMRFELSIYRYGHEIKKR
ncbi:hypothetical protein ABE44_20475 [Bacillus thuringiensis]|uniref:metallophosphoesterase n=1 Tax=Bacillus thuringiensis TaxID=1428 RepID=UPI0018CF2567|nr:metallophosphoesterase [Bacillus thuringiensis]MBG9501338.1 hypothetical protein [Bacillus thuringiensis]